MASRGVPFSRHPKADRARLSAQQYAIPLSNNGNNSSSSSSALRRRLYASASSNGALNANAVCYGGGAIKGGAINTTSHAACTTVEDAARSTNEASTTPAGCSNRGDVPPFETARWPNRQRLDAIRAAAEEKAAAMAIMVRGAAGATHWESAPLSKDAAHQGDGESPVMLSLSAPRHHNPTRPSSTRSAAAAAAPVRSSATALLGLSPSSPQRFLNAPPPHLISTTPATESIAFVTRPAGCLGQLPADTFGLIGTPPIASLKSPFDDACRFAVAERQYTSYAPTGLPSPPVAAMEAAGMGHVGLRGSGSVRPAAAVLRCAALEGLSVPPSVHERGFFSSDVAAVSSGSGASSGGGGSVSDKPKSTSSSTRTCVWSRADALPPSSAAAAQSVHAATRSGAHFSASGAVTISERHSNGEEEREASLAAAGGGPQSMPSWEERCLRAHTAGKEAPLVGRMALPAAAFPHPSSSALSSRALFGDSDGLIDVEQAAEVKLADVQRRLALRSGR